MAETTRKIERIICFFIGSNLVFVKNGTVNRIKLYESVVAPKLRKLKRPGPLNTRFFPLHSLNAWSFLPTIRLTLPKIIV